VVVDASVVVVVTAASVAVVGSPNVVTVEGIDVAAGSSTEDTEVVSPPHAAPTTASTITVVALIRPSTPLTRIAITKGRGTTPVRWLVGDFWRLTLRDGCRHGLKVMAARNSSTSG
jgi:hypothetical protein